ncbi:hypothetical protein D033_4629B, partial [Vibrio parahaemolyticus B-265]
RFTANFNAHSTYRLAT